MIPDGAKPRNPWWLGEIPTITASSMIIMRYGVVSNDAELTLSQELNSALSGDPRVEVRLRQLDGMELLQFIGYEARSMKSPWPDHKLATSLAGNAFSGFNLIPCVMALVAAMQPDCVLTIPNAPGFSGDSDDEAM